MSSITAFGGTIPRNYETYLGPLFFEPYALDLAQRLKDGGYTSVLELACGTGQVTKHLVKKVAPGGRLHATDLNADMLKIAREQVKEDHVEWVVADAHSLPFGDAQFDLVVCQYGVMFFEDKPKAMREVFRVLKPGGHFVFNTWDEVRHNAVARLTEKALQMVFPHDPPTFFMKGPHSLFNTDELKQLLAEAGFVKPGYESVSKTGVASSADDVLKGILDGTPVSAFLNERPLQAGEVRKQLRHSLVQQYGETNLHLPMQAFVCTGTKP